MKRALTVVRAALPLAIGVAACKPTGSSTEAGTSVAPADAETTKAAATNRGASDSGPTRFAGTYDAQPGPMHIPRDGDVPNAAEWAGTKFRGDDAGVGRGAGTILLEVDAAGTIIGKGEGSLGAFELTGRRTADRFAGTLRGTTADAFLGTFDLHLEGSSLRGEARASDGEARVVRILAITMAKP